MHAFELEPRRPHGVGMRFAKIELAWHTLRRAQGKFSDAEEHLQRAEALIRQISDQIEDPQTRDSFQTSVLARRVRAARHTFAATKT